MDGQHDLPKGELKFLERLSIEELEALLRFSGDPADVEMLFDMIVEEVVAREEKNPTGRLPDVDSSWEELQVMYQNLQDRETPTSEGAVLGRVPKLLAAPAKDKPKRISLMKVIRTTAVMAAAVVLTLALMVGAQAAGTDVFGALAQWTSDTLHLNIIPNENSYAGDICDDMVDVLNVRSILGKYAPAHYPDGFNVTDVRIIADEHISSFQILLSSNDGRNAYICVDKYSEGQDINFQTFELESEFVTEYLSHGKMFYLFSNSDIVTAVWSDRNTTLQRIWGELTDGELKNMIDSIGE